MLVVVDWPVYPRLAHTMRASNDAQTRGRCGAPHGLAGNVRKRLLPNFAPVRLAWLASCGGLEGNGAEIPEISLSLAIVLAPMYTSLPSCCATRTPSSGLSASCRAPADWSA